MKSSRLALMVWACTAASAAFAQGALPQCETSNWDQARGVFTVMNAAAGIGQQECVLTIHPAQAAGAQFPAPFLVEGYYDVVMSGGGGGGGGGDTGGGGGGGAGATPFKTIKLLLPGMYKLTLGAGGEGGRPGGFAQAGSPTSLTDANTGQHIAGFEGADNWRARYVPPGSGRGGIAAWGGSNGGDGAKFNPTVLASSAQAGSPLQVTDYSGTPGQAGGVIDRSVRTAQPGGMLQISGYAGSPGPAGGGEPIRTARTNDGRVVDAFAGGGGGAGFGDGGVGQPPDARMPAGNGELGGGGGGGRGGKDLADAGGHGGHGFIQLAMSEPYVVAAAPEVAPPPPPMATTPEPAVTPSAPPVEPPASRPARRDRN